MSGGGSSRSAAASSSRKTLDDPSTDAHQELLTEHFGFHPRVFVDALVYAANEHLYSIGAQFEEFAKASLKAAARRAAKRDKERAGRAGERGASSTSHPLAKLTSREIEAQAEQGVHGVLTLLENALDHVFDLLELYCLKTVLGLRPSQAAVVTLRHHKGLDLRSAQERARDGVALSADAESRELVAREEELRHKLENVSDEGRILAWRLAFFRADWLFLLLAALLSQARRVRHALRLGEVSAARGFKRMQILADSFSVLLAPVHTEAQEGAHVLRPSLPQRARKLRLDAEALIEAFEALRDTDPLGASLLVNPDSSSSASATLRRPSDQEKRRILSDSGVSDHEKRGWERGREAYINWEMDRIIRNVKTRTNTAAFDTTLFGGGDQTVVANAVPASAAGQRRSMARASIAPVSTGAAAITSDSPRSKRRRTTRYSQAANAEDCVSEHQAAQIGDTAEVEALVNRLTS